MSSFYGTQVEANQYFAGRLHTAAWDRSSASDRLAAMCQATELIDQFDYIGFKYATQTAIDAQPDTFDWTTAAAMSILRDADQSQELEFPRGDSEVVPTEIEQSCYLIAQKLLAGREPNKDLENLSIVSDSYGQVKNTYQRDGALNEHVAHLIPSPEAWTLIRPFLRERDTFTIKRVS